MYKSRADNTTTYCYYIDVTCISRRHTGASYASWLKSGKTNKPLLATTIFGVFDKK